MNKLMNKLNYKLLCLLGLITFNSLAQDDHSAEPFKIHGFVAQGIIDVNGSDFVNDEDGLSLELLKLASTHLISLLMISALPHKLSI